VDVILATPSLLSNKFAMIDRCIFTQA